uniref:Uncharacterized protein n=1 Tax=Arundo donax TaxID=35708 RepID=A0A0A8ZCB7_ARUDO
MVQHQDQNLWRLHHVPSLSSLEDVLSLSSFSLHHLHLLHPPFIVS